MFRIVLLLITVSFMLPALSTCGCLPMEFNFQEVDAIAVYQFTSPYRDLTPEEINFNITDPQVIDDIMAGIDFEDVIDGSILGTRPEAYIYFRDSSGNVEKGKAVCAWFRLLVQNEWGRLFYLDETSSEIMKGHIQQ